MLQSKQGQRIPEVTLPIHDAETESWKQLSTRELFAGKTVVVFSLPGAFTPACSSAHVPRYDELAGTFEALGVDEIVCVSVNDSFVMNAWKADQGAERVRFIPDGNGEFTRAMGMLVEKADLGFGERSWRYSMLVCDGLIKKMFIEPEKDGDPFEVSDADTMLDYLDPAATRPDDVIVFTKPGCDHCARAKKALEDRGIAFVDLPATPAALRAVAGRATTPQVFINGEHIGGADELVERLGG